MGDGGELERALVDVTGTVLTIMSRKAISEKKNFAKDA